MNRLLKTSLFILFGVIFSMPLASFGQECLVGLRQNPVLMKASKQGWTRADSNAVKLPFVDDFSTCDHYPDPQLWQDQQAFINSSYAIVPPTIGVATLDALDANGQIYAHASRDVFAADTLTSVPIRLDSNFTHNRAMNVGDSLYFSFYYQPGGGCASYPAVAWELVGDEPEADDQLILEFGYATGNLVFVGYSYADYQLSDDEYYVTGDTMENPYMPDVPYVVESDAYPGDVIQIPADSLFGPEYIWNEVWSTDGCSLDSWLAENPLQYFKQVMIPITDSQYLRDNFQFRFRNYASLDLDSWSSNNIVGWTSNCDQWHIDYIILNTDRTQNDIYPNDVTFVSPTTTALSRYQSMPWHQYRTTDMATQFNNQLANISNSTKNTFYNYKVTKADGSNLYTSTLNNENAAAFNESGLHTYAYHATPSIDFVYPTDDADSAIFTITHVFRMEGANDELKRNDTCIFEQIFYNYFAYDDGTAESGYCLLSSDANPASSLAVQFTLAQPDTLHCVRMWFNSALDDENIDEFTLMVWDDDNGVPGEVIYSQSAQLPYHADDFLDFANYYLDDPLAISGTFYVGFYQSHNTQLNLGFDQNNDARGYFFYKTSNEWRESYYKGTPMIRPVVGKSFDHSGVTDYTTNHVVLYPNPTTNNLYIQMDDSLQEAKYQLFDQTGRLIRGGDMNEGVIRLDDLCSGLYIVKISNGKQIIQTEKIIKR